MKGDHRSSCFVVASSTRFIKLELRSAVHDETKLSIRHIQVPDTKLSIRHIQVALSKMGLHCFFGLMFREISILLIHYSGNKIHF